LLTCSEVLVIYFQENLLTRYLTEPVDCWWLVIQVATIGVFR
jgi:hypothetical protein